MQYFLGMKGQISASIGSYARLFTVFFLTQNYLEIKGYLKIFFDAESMHGPALLTTKQHQNTPVEQNFL